MSSHCSGNHETPSRWWVSAAWGYPSIDLCRATVSPDEQIQRQGSWRLSLSHSCVVLAVCLGSLLKLWSRLRVPNAEVFQVFINHISVLCFVQNVTNCDKVKGSKFWMHCVRLVVVHPFSKLASPTTPNKPLAPLDWASGVTTKPDPSIVNKHIRKVVEVSGYCTLSKHVHGKQRSNYGLEVEMCMRYHWSNLFLVWLCLEVCFQELWPWPRWLYFSRGLWEHRCELSLPRLLLRFGQRSVSIGKWSNRVTVFFFF